jgi:hypothetical protein
MVDFFVNCNSGNFYQLPKGNNMKRIIAISAVSVILAACNSAPKRVEAPPIPSPTPPVTKDVTVPVQGKVDAPPTLDIPAWYIKAPASTDDYVYVTGTAVSSDLAMSRTKALLDAQVQLADKINGMLNALTKQTRKDDSGQVGIDRTSQTVKKLIIDTALTGYHLEDSRVMSENRNYRTFVLVRYPLGDANRLLKDKLQRERQDKEDVDNALDELEREIKSRKKPASAPLDDKQGSIDTVDTQVAQLDSVPKRLSLDEIVAIEKQHNLVETKNMDLRRRRAEALTKPGAFVQRFTVQ